MAKFAIILNGDTEQRHLDNVEKSTARLKEEGFTVFVASPERPSRADEYSDAHGQTDFLRLIDKLAGRAGNKDELVIYTTGHGGKDGLCIGHNCSGGRELAKQLDSIKFGRRFVIMDQCFSGNWQNFFVDDGRTMFASAGSKDETVCCQEYAPRLWEESAKIIAQGGDQNRDGRIDIFERASFAARMTKTSLPMVSVTEGFKADGSAMFEKGVREVETERGLESAISSVKNHPGRYAIITFSAPSCNPCQEFKPSFKKQAEEAAGMHLFAVTENEGLAHKYGIRSFPSIVLFDHTGRRFVVSDRTRILKEIALSSFSIEQRLEIYRQRMSTPGGTEERMRAILAYSNMILENPGEAKAEAVALRGLFGERVAGVRAAAAFAYGSIAKKLGPTEKKSGAVALRSLFGDRGDEVRSMAVPAYISIVEKLDPAGAKAEAVTLRGLFGDRDAYVRSAAAYSYGHIAEKLGPAEAKAGAAALRGLFGDRDDKVRFEAASAYSSIAEKLGPAEAKAGAVALRGLFGDPASDVRSRAAYSYRRIAEKLNPREAKVGAVALRGLFGDLDSHVRTAAVYSYRRIAEKLDSAEAKVGAVALRRLFGEEEFDDSVRYNAVGAYGDIAEKLDPGEAEAGAVAVRRLFGDRDSKVRFEATLAFRSIAKKLDRPRQRLGRRQ